jgi:hypothetical protein
MLVVVGGQVTPTPMVLVGLAVVVEQENLGQREQQTQGLEVVVHHLVILELVAQES